MTFILFSLKSPKGLPSEGYIKTQINSGANTNMKFMYDSNNILTAEENMLETVDSPKPKDFYMGTEYYGTYAKVSDSNVN